MDIIKELEQLQKCAEMEMNRLCVIKNAANLAIGMCEKMINVTATLVEKLASNHEEETKQNG